MYLLEKFVVHMGIYLSGRNRRVSQKGLYRPDISAFFEKRCRKGMTQGMWCYFFVDPSFTCILSYDVLHCIPCESLSSLIVAEVDKKVWAFITSSTEILFKFFSGALSEEDRSHFLSLSDYSELIAIELNVRSLERNKLADT